MYATKGMSVSELIGCFIRKTGLLGRYQKGLGHLQFQQYEKAHRIWLGLAENGHAQAQFDLGIMFHNGLGLEKDEEMALYWFEKAASQNHADAENYLGAIHKTGRGVAQDIGKAQMYFKRAMEHGNEDARSNYSELLAHGLPKQSREE